MSIEIGSTVIYNGTYNTNLVIGQSYIISYIIYNTNQENSNTYYYLEEHKFEVYDSFYFSTLIEYRKIKLQALEKI